MIFDELNLDGMDLTELVELKSLVCKKIKHIEQQNTLQLIRMIQSEADKMGVKMEDILSAYPKFKVGTHKSLKVKYKDEAGNTWTGRGRAPHWLLERLGVEKLNRSDPDQLRELSALLVPGSLIS